MALGRGEHRDDVCHCHQGSVRKVIALCRFASTHYIIDRGTADRKSITLHASAMRRIPYRAIAVAFIESACLAWVDISIWAVLIAGNIRTMVEYESRMACNTPRITTLAAAQCLFPTILVRAVHSTSHLNGHVNGMVQGICQCSIVIRLGRIKRNQDRDARHVPHLSTAVIQEALASRPSAPNQACALPGVRMKAAHSPTDDVLDISSGKNLDFEASHGARTMSMYAKSHRP